MASFFDIGCACNDDTVSGADALTRAQALDALGLVDRTLSNAYSLIQRVSFVAARANLKIALSDQINQLRGYAGKVRAEVAKAPEGPLAASLAAKVTLAAKQAHKALGDTDKAVSGSQAPLLPDFLAAMKQILAGAALALPGWVWPVGAGLAAVSALVLARGRR